MDPFRASLIGVIISVAVALTFSGVFNVGPGDIAAIGLTTLAVASLLGVARLFIRGLAFRILIKSYAPDFGRSFNETLNVRLASEFVAMSTPALVGGEILRVAWLSRAGVKAANGLWITTVEAFHDIAVVAAIGLLAAVYAVLRGDVWLGTIIAAAALLPAAVFVGVMLVVVGKMRLPWRWVRPVLDRFVGSARAASFTQNAESAWEDYASAAKAYFHCSSASLLLKMTALSLVNGLLAGLIVFFLFSPDGMGFAASVLAAHAAFALGNLPVTPGGAGLNELGISLFSSIELGFTPWRLVVAWRIASYYVGLLITGITLVFLAGRAIMKPRDL
ncbi:MAG: flippase-like domain-containing protein [Candidatus Bathyarchaeia archaeon]